MWEFTKDTSKGEHNKNLFLIYCPAWNSAVWAQDFLYVLHSELRYLLPSWQFPLSVPKDKSQKTAEHSERNEIAYNWSEKWKEGWSQTLQDKALIPGFLKERELGELVARTTCCWGKSGCDKEMGELWLFLLLPLPLAAFLGVKGCLECDPRFIKDIKSLLAKLVPSEVPGRTELLDRQIKAMTNLSLKVSHGNKMLPVLGEGSLRP